jgi:NTE family protein
MTEPANQTADVPPDKLSDDEKQTIAEFQREVIWKFSCLCLSGGGFRATLFHLGAIQRFNELGILSRLGAITSVSGGSILNGLLACNWSRLKLDKTSGVFTNLKELVALPMREFCAKDLRTPMMVGTRLNPLNWPVIARDRLSVSANFLAEGYEPLYYGTRLSNLPEPSERSPVFVFCATNEASGECWQFHGGPHARMGDPTRGYCDVGRTRVCEAVAASSAFPPGFSAFRLKIPDGIPLYTTPSYVAVGPSDQRKEPASGRADEAREITNEILLTDGGVYDNLALEPVWNDFPVIFVSDAGLPFQSCDRLNQFLISRLKRSSDIGLNQVADLRKRWLLSRFTQINASTNQPDRLGTIFAMDSNLNKIWEHGQVPAGDRHGYGDEARESIQRVRTDLDAFSDAEIACLENHGYAMANAALVAHFREYFPNNDVKFCWPHEHWSRDYRAVQALSKSHERGIVRDVARYLVGSLIGEPNFTTKILTRR